MQPTPNRVRPARRSLPPGDGIPLAPLHGVEPRYEVDLNGYHSPLAVAEIEALVRAGALRQKDPCRPVGQEGWQTVNELFPKLKYDSARA